MEMYTKVVTISGLPGSGKSTVATLFAEKTGMHYFNTGMIFRELATKYGMDLLDFEHYCEQHQEVDQELDNRQVSILKKGNIILEGRLSGWLAHRYEIDAFKIWLSCDETETIRRIIEREGGQTNDIRIKTKKRIASEKKRYRELYKINLDDLSIYDLIIDTTNVLPSIVVERILAIYKA